MSKNQEELKQLKLELETFNNKLKDLSDEEIKEITGGKIIKINPDQSIFSPTNKNPNDLGLINNKPVGNVDFKNAEFNGSVSNHNDQSDQNNFKPPFHK